MISQPTLQPGIQIGDYLLKELISEGQATRTWYADQISVQREVMIDSLRSVILKDPEVRAAFLEDVRAKAAISHPFIGSVFETVQLENICFYARERLTGDTLEHYLERSQKLTPSHIVKILKQIAEANIYLEQRNIGTTPIFANQIYIDSKLLTRIVNMAINEPRDHSVSTQDKATIGNILLNLLDFQNPGATRVNSLLAYMVDTNREIPITWEQILELSEQVEKQLREQIISQQEEGQTTTLINDKDIRRNTIIVLSAAAGILLFGFASVMLYTGPQKSHARDLSQMVNIEETTIIFRDDTVIVPPFSIDAHEVTIAEYAAFLKDVETLGINQFREHYQPGNITSFEPKDWETMYKAASEGTAWQGHIMNLNQPITNITWWAAKAYANWATYKGNGEKYDLPTEAQWLACLKEQDLNNLKPAEWNEVDRYASDRTSHQIYGLAGGVSEWTNATELNVDGSEELPVVLGSSFLIKDKGASKRSIFPQRNITRSDIGFRLVKQN